MLTKELVRTVVEHVQKRPCTVQEIATLLNKNWRTADRYVQQIAEETGLIGTRTFRDGTRGALKIIYSQTFASTRGTAYQEGLLLHIERGRRKEDFSPFDIYQFASPQKREAFLEKKEFSQNKKLTHEEVILGAKSHLFSFSGNLSWIGLRPGVMAALEDAAKQKISIKILTRIDVVSQENVARVLAINERVGWDAVEVRHCDQPIRGVIVDGRLALLREVLAPDQHRELHEKIFLFYRLEDGEWVAWLERVFFHLWNQSVDARTRLAALDTIHGLLSIPTTHS